MELRLRMLSEGIKKHAPKDVPILSVLYPTVAALLVVVEGLLAIYANARELRDAAKKAKVLRDASRDRAMAVVQDGRLFAGLVLGRENPELSSFGFKPETKPKPLTAEERALQVARSRATREARGTLGRKKKEAVKGSVDHLVIRDDAESEKSARGLPPPPPPPAQ